MKLQTTRKQKYQRAQSVNASQYQKQTAQRQASPDRFKYDKHEPAVPAKPKDYLRELAAQRKTKDLEYMNDVEELILQALEDTKRQRSSIKLELFPCKIKAPKNTAARAEVVKKVTPQPKASAPRLSNNKIKPPTRLANTSRTYAGKGAQYNTTTKPEKVIPQKSSEARISKHLTATQQRLVKKYTVAPMERKKIWPSKSQHQLNLPSNEELSFTKQSSVDNQQQSTLTLFQQATSQSRTAGRRPKHERKKQVARDSGVQGISSIASILQSTPLNSKDYALSLGAQTSRNRPTENLLDGFEKSEMPQVNQFRTDDETQKDEELIENEIFLSPIVESALGLQDLDRDADVRQDEYLPSPEGDIAHIITRRSSKNELGISINSHNKININYEVSNPGSFVNKSVTSSHAPDQGWRRSKFCTQCGFQFSNITDKFCGACGSRRI